MSISTDVLERLFRAGAKAWPEVKCTPSAFAACVEWAGLTDGVQANAADIYLAAAVVSGDPAASGVFDATYLRTQRARLARMGLDEDDVEEVLQRVRTQLLMPRSGSDAPRLAELAGQGNFHALIRVVSIRTALNLRRSEGRRRRNEDVAAAELLSVNHRGVLREVMSAEAVVLLREAIESAIMELDARQRTLLRLHLSHGMTIDDIGRVYNVHRSTAARWLSSVRDTIEKKVKVRLREERGQSTTNLEELFDLASSQLQISFNRLLATAS